MVKGSAKDGARMLKVSVAVVEVGKKSQGSMNLKRHKCKSWWSLLMVEPLTVVLLPNMLPMHFSDTNIPALRSEYA